MSTITTSGQKRQRDDDSTSSSGDISSNTSTNNNISNNSDGAGVAAVRERSGDTTANITSRADHTDVLADDEDNDDKQRDNKKMRRKEVVKHSCAGCTKETDDANYCMRCNKYFCYDHKMEKCTLMECYVCRCFICYKCRKECKEAPLDPPEEEEWDSSVPFGVDATTGLPSDKKEEEDKKRAKAIDDNPNIRCLDCGEAKVSKEAERFQKILANHVKFAKDISNDYLSYQGHGERLRSVWAYTPFVPWDKVKALLERPYRECAHGAVATSTATTKKKKKGQGVLPGEYNPSPLPPLLPTLPPVHVKKGETATVGTFALDVS